MATWRELIAKEMGKHGESWDNVEAQQLGGAEQEFFPRVENLDLEFNDGHGGGGRDVACYFTVWTKSRVYFPVIYDGALWCASVPRHPCDEATQHVGSYD